MNGCAKRRYRTEVDAKIFLARISRAGDDSQREKTPVRAYRCGKCGGWHLTSQSRGAS